MAKAKITCKEGYTCAPEGSIVKTIPYGTTVDGHVAEWACKAQAARWLDKKKLRPTLEDKNLVPNLKDKASK